MVCGDFHLGIFILFGVEMLDCLFNGLGFGLILGRGEINIVEDDA